VPPLSLGEIFEDAYDIILILDDREQFATQGLVTWILRYYFHSGYYMICIALSMVEGQNSAI